MFDGVTMSLSIPAAGLAAPPIIQRSVSAVEPVWKQIAGSLVLIGGNYTTTIPTTDDVAFFRAMVITGYRADVKGHLQADSFSVKSSDTGVPMYLHVTSLGVATWTTSP